MIVMTSNVWDPAVRALDVRYPGCLGNLVSPGAMRRQMSERYALDCGRFQPVGWGAKTYLAHLDRAAELSTPPRFVVVPDVFGDLWATVREWDRWSHRLRARYPGWALAVCWQPPKANPTDLGETVRAMTSCTDAEVQFLGGPGRTRWGLAPFVSREWPRVHIGRVNRVESAMRAWRLGVESIDGTGWRLTDRQRKGLVRLLDTMERGERHLTPTLLEEVPGT